jgi:4-hydroxybenzoate polyprenyltransferase
VSSVPDRDRAHAQEAIRDNAVPLVVDLDGTLLKSDLLWEGLASLLTRRPIALLRVIGYLPRGRAAVKTLVARESGIGAPDVPLNPRVVELIQQARAEGRTVVIASAAHESQLNELGESLGADSVWGSDIGTNLSGRAKLAKIQQRFPEFDYVGNSGADLPLWRAARRAISFSPGYATLWRARRARPDLIVINQERGRWRSALRALRPHQWAKNTLMFLPAVAAHLQPTLPLALRLIAGFAAFSALASAGYLLNDIADLSADRAHPVKRHRALAAGDLSIPSAILMAFVLLLASVALGWALSATFAGLLGLYFALAMVYSWRLKALLVLDVITLATLYTMRIIAGAALADVPLSRWFLVFSVFFFFSLALVKRVVELDAVRARNREKVSGRDYRLEDIPVLIALGAAAAAASALVYCLYISGDDVLRLYSNPDWLWLGLPLFLYWIARVWILAGRGMLREDPVAFALRDRITYLVMSVFLLTVWLAA